jgi:hypothetical protein
MDQWTLTPAELDTELVFKNQKKKIKWQLNGITANLLHNIIIPRFPIYVVILEFRNLHSTLQRHGLALLI